MPWFYNLAENGMTYFTRSNFNWPGIYVPVHAVRNTYVCFWSQDFVKQQRKISEQQSWRCKSTAVVRRNQTKSCDTKHLRDNNDDGDDDDDDGTGYSNAPPSSWRTTLANYCRISRDSTTRLTLPPWQVRERVTSTRPAFQYLIAMLNVAHSAVLYWSRYQSILLINYSCRFLDLSIAAGAQLFLLFTA